MLTDKRLLDPHFEVGRISAVEATQFTVEIRKDRVRNVISGFGDAPATITFGSYVAALCDEVSVVLGKVSELAAPEGTNINAIAKCEILSSFSLLKNKAERGVTSRPRIGQLAYVVPATFIPFFLGSAGETNIEIGNLNDSQYAIKVSLKDLFAKHCAIVGNTGGGKSWSVASIIEKASPNLKFILIDATGEFSGFDPGTTVHVDVGSRKSVAHSELVAFTYRNLTVEDMFAFFRPSAQAQAPVLKEAIKTLKLIEAGHLGASQESGCFQKTNATRANYERAYAIGNRVATDATCNFNLDLLVEQIRYECININSWVFDNQMFNWQQTLILRIEAWKSTQAIQCLWDTTLPSLTDKVDDFLSSEKRILRISLKNLSFEFSTREILVNAFCRYLMRRARDGDFEECPAVLAVDEAHNFFKPSFKMGEDEIANEALDIIAKEGRKYGLMLMIATQRPKDIPAGVMSQIGSIVCHRITNAADAEILRGAVGEFNKNILKVLPTLTQGEAFLTTPSFTFPVSIRIAKPTFEPDSDDPI